jgi:hypothetical protein
MKLTLEPAVDLTYCTNIHPGNGWSEVLANLRQYAPALKQRLSPHAPFGLGLRLSAVESEELLPRLPSHDRVPGAPWATGRVMGADLPSRDRQGAFLPSRDRQGVDHLEHFRDFLAENGLYVALLNGFPYGSFHRRVIKEDVFAPDWRDENRVQYTLRLIRILKALLPAGQDGGISTSPLSYKRWMALDDRAAWESMTRNIVRVAEALVRVRQTEDRFIHLDIEPEPDGLIENSAELVAFYQDWLLPVGGPFLADALGIPVDEARRHLLDHIQVCLDTCHVAVEYEEPEVMLARFEQAGIRVGRLQISSALRVNLPGPVESGKLRVESPDRRNSQFSTPDSQLRTLIARQLEPFAESSYLHQVIEQRDDGSLHHYPDLADALPMIHAPRARQWRVHFHVPLFVEEYGLFGSTQEEIRPFFRAAPFTRHLEIETYTWEVLPPALKEDLSESILREYRWVLEALAVRSGELAVAGGTGLRG